MWPFTANCPVDDETREWVESRMEWLAKEFGLELWWNTPAIEPSDEFFPDRFDGSEHSIRQMLDRVCGYMGVDPKRIALRLYSDDRNRHVGSGILIKSESSSPTGTYSGGGEQEVVSIEVSSNREAGTLAATMAHEVAHARLLGERRLDSEEEDHEKVTDLATVFFGLGIFNANAVISFQQWSNGRWAGWKSSKMGYLDEPTFGYALGLWAYVRNQRQPFWMKHLRAGPRSVMAKTLRYLNANPQNRFAGRRKRIV